MCLVAAGISPATQAIAQDMMARVGDWEYGADAELAAASTQNADGAMFGLVCSPSCIGFIKIDRPCEERQAYDGLMRSPGRADPLRLECRRIDEGYSLLFTPTAAFIDTLRNGPEVTVSMRLGGDADIVYRFSLNGAFDAVYATLATAIAAGGDAPRAEPGS